MLTKAEEVRVVQNLGLTDRIVRFALGAALMAPGIAAASAALVGSGPTLNTWMVTMMAISVYPLMTAMIGVDPLYRLFRIRSCSDSGTNQCGTLPYQLRARKGEAPAYCEVDDTHSLEACHDDARPQPRHASWRVDQSPMLYPDDSAMEEYAERQKSGKRG